MENRRAGPVDLLIGLIALVPWRTAVYVALQLSIVVRTFDAYLKWALPVLFIAGPVLAYVQERRGLARRRAGGGADGRRAGPGPLSGAELTVR